MCTEYKDKIKRQTHIDATDYTTSNLKYHFKNLGKNLPRRIV